MRGAITYEGRRYYVSGKDAKEVAANKALKLKELEAGKKIESSMLVRDWAKEWLMTYKAGSCNDKTFKDYEHRLDAFILPEIGHIRLKDVKPVHLQRIMQKVSRMSQSRIDKIYQCLGQVFLVAENNDLIAKSPARAITKPKGTSGTHRAITDQERQVILKVAETHKHGLWVKLMLYCGLRTGETAQVKICHFDHEKKLLYIDGTKNKNAKRYVPVPDEILEAVKATKKGPFEYLFTNETGRPIQPHNRGRMWQSFKKAMHIEMGGKLFRDAILPPCLVADDLVPYCLRHTFCTDLQDAGVSINVAKELMGHSDISLTSKIYTHYTEASLNNAAALLQQYRGENAEKSTGKEV
ncbi:site-specific integrase [bacterium 210820-DFI.6.37]|nr:site-specific integrase [bacterium 210820-DFI.6.37]